MEEVKIIFLDIDGVLNCIPQGHDEHGAIFHKHFVDNLERIIKETGAKIVISSSWRSAGLEGMRKMWKDRGYAGEIIDITPYGNTDMQYYDRESKRAGATTPRGCEIEWWLNEKKYDTAQSMNIVSYVILDDDKDFLLTQQDNFVQCSENTDDEDCIDVGYGLTNYCTEKAIAILNGNFKEELNQEEESDFTMSRTNKSNKKERFSKKTSFMCPPFKESY